MITAEQFEKMAEVLFFQIIGGGPRSWEMAHDRAKEGWRRIVAEQLKAAGVEFERPEAGEGW